MNFQEVYETKDDVIDFDKFNNMNREKKLIYFSNTEQLNRKMDDQNKLSYNKKDQSISSFNVDPKSIQQQETITEKINRLKLDFNTFKEDIEIMMENKTQQQQITPILQDIQKIESQIGQISINKGFNDKDYPLENNQYIMNQQIQSQVNYEIFNKLQNIQQDQDHKTDVKFEIYLNHNIQNVETSQQEHDLEKRLAILENIVGIKDLSTDNTNLLQKLENLEQNCAQFSYDYIEETKKKINHIKIEMQQVIQNDKFVQQDETIKKISDLYECLQQNQNSNQELQMISERLDSLKNLHDQSSIINNQIDEFLKVHQNILQLINNNEILITDYKKEQQESYKTLQNEITILDQRLSKI